MKLVRETGVLLESHSGMFPGEQVREARAHFDDELNRLELVCWVLYEDMPARKWASFELSGLTAKGIAALTDELIRRREAKQSVEPAPYYLVERNDRGRAEWSSWRNRDQLEWVTDVHQADRFDWPVAASREARILGLACPGVALVVTEHLDVPVHAAAAPRGRWRGR